MTKRYVFPWKSLGAMETDADLPEVLISCRLTTVYVHERDL